MTQELSHDAKVMLFVLYHVEELREHGLVNGGTPLSPEGKEQYHKLMASGFTPTDEEIHSCARFLFRRDKQEIENANPK